MNHPESIIQAEIVKVLQEHHVFCASFFNEGAGGDTTARIRMGQAIRTGLKKGMPDLEVHWPTRFSSPNEFGWMSNTEIGYIEVKTPTGKQSDAQKQMEKRLTLGGHEYRIVRSISDLYQLMAEHRVPFIKDPIKAME